MCFIGYFYYIDPGNYVVEPGFCAVAPEHIKKAMLKMGPHRQYRILTDGRLQVKINGNWYNLQTEIDEDIIIPGEREPVVLRWANAFTSRYIFKKYSDL